MNNAPHVCPLCKGDGKLKTNMTVAEKTCHACDGKGIVWPPSASYPMPVPQPYPVPVYPRYPTYPWYTWGVTTTSGTRLPMNWNDCDAPGFANVVVSLGREIVATTAQSSRKGDPVI